MTIGSALKRAANKLKNKSASAVLDSEVILAYVLEHDRSWVIANYDKKISLWQLLIFTRLIHKKQKGLPVAYITGRKEFFGRNFVVNRHVLIPRPETEILIEEALDILQQNNSIKNIIDIGTGSGCIGITLALETNHHITAIDISPKAIMVAQKNALNYKVLKKIKFLKGNLLTPIISDPASSFTNALIISNPPYIRSSEITQELEHEPKIALNGGKFGLKYYYNLITQISALPIDKIPSVLLLELHPPTADAVKKIIKECLPAAHIKIKNDLANSARIAIVRI